MGAGRTGLFPGTKGSDSQQITLFPAPISVHHRGPTYDMNDGCGESIGGAGSVDVGIRSEDRVLLLIPLDILKMCLRWRIGAITEGGLLSWIQKRLNDKRYRMKPTELRRILEIYLIRLQETKSAGKGYDHNAFLSVIEKLEKKLKAL